MYTYVDILHGGGRAALRGKAEKGDCYWVGGRSNVYQSHVGKAGKSSVFPQKEPTPHLNLNKGHKMTLLLIGFDPKIDKTHCWTFLARMMRDVNKVHDTPDYKHKGYEAWSNAIDSVFRRTT